MKIKTAELEGAALDWAVAQYEGYKPHAAASLTIMGAYSPSTKWAHGRPSPLETLEGSTGERPDHTEGEYMSKVDMVGEIVAGAAVFLAPFVVLIIGAALGLH